MPAEGEEGTNLVAVIRRAVNESGLSLSELGKRSGVSAGQLSRFMRGERHLSLESAEKLMEYLGVRVIAPPRPRGKLK